MNERERLSSRLGFIMLSAGCAIGCGNVWKFPWMCGQNGGGSFMLLYILCLLVLGLPVMVMEFAVGRAAQASPVTMYQRLEKPGHKWGVFGVVSLIGNIAIMVPMIISVWEVQKVKEIMAEIRAELDAQKIPYGKVEFGIMIETPAAVIIADELAKEVDFFSIGTNDLTQYTLAIDRQNAKLDMFYDSHHPAVLKMIQMVIDSAHKEGIWAGICGELGADTTLTEQFVAMGIDELSVSPAMVLPVRERVVGME